MLDPFDPTPPKAPAAAVPPVAEVAADEDTDESTLQATDAEAEAAAEPDAEAAEDSDDDEVWEADEVLVNATDQARSALELITPADTIGEPLGYIVEGEHVLSLLFDCLMTGYPGWRWTVSLSRVDGDAAPQVLETELTPGDDALLAPEWVPWIDRLADAKVAEELAAAELAGDDEFDDDDASDDDSDDASDDDDDDDDDDDASDDDDDDDDDEALTESASAEQDEAETGQAEAEADGGAPQPPVQARGMQFSAEDNGARQGD